MRPLLNPHHFIPPDVFTAAGMGTMGLVSLYSPPPSSIDVENLECDSPFNANNTSPSRVASSGLVVVVQMVNKYTDK